MDAAAVNHAHRKSDFATERGTQMVAIAVAAVYGVAMGVVGTLIVQWITA